MINNPLGMLAQMFGNNPQFNQIMGMVQGKNPQQLENYVKNLYQSQGVDIQQVANRLGIKL